MRKIWSKNLHCNPVNVGSSSPIPAFDIPRTMMHCQATTSLAQFSLFVRGWRLPLLHSSPSFHPSSSFILPSVAEVVNLHCDGHSSQQLSQLAIHSRNIPLLQKWGLTQGFSRYGGPDNGLKERLECSFRSLHPRTKLENAYLSGFGLMQV